MCVCVCVCVCVAGPQWRPVRARAARMNSSGVGIKTTPGSYTLNVNGTTLLNNSTYITGNTGIGISNPNCRLFISTNAENNVNSFAIRVSRDVISDVDTEPVVWGVMNGISDAGELADVTVDAGVKFELRSVMHD